MSKRKFSEVEGGRDGDPFQSLGPNKNSLDSDEEDSEDENDQYALQDDDIEGQEDGVVAHEEGVQITPFNMKEEMEEGHFDQQGMYHWKKEKVAKDNWLENIDWIKVRQTEKPLPGDPSGNEEELPEAVDVNALYKDILEYLQPKESIAKALKRLGGNKSLSASERLKLKKAGRTLDLSNNNGEKVTKLTELANKILTHAGNMDIYQETYEYIFDKVNASSSKSKAEPELDMYADDFDEKEKERLNDVQIKSNNITDEKEGNSSGGTVMWEYKTDENSEEIKGPFTSQQMDKWAQSGHFGKGVLVRKCGTDVFYTSNRMDFDLYI
ncbi:hypothetical protein O3M35_007257 [Rhynocoris fuscipes]|uniref:GYF domain-containing protein n=1 Tax=Rhynocoris fuscipes TaxID=488301 RepID=A0AAW1DAB9_9HEMI